MYLKGIFFIAILFVVNATEITPDAHDDEVPAADNVALEDNSFLRSCNNQECDQRCRRLKYKGGVCVNGRCKCDLFRTFEGEEPPSTGEEVHNKLEEIDLALDEVEGAIMERGLDTQEDSKNPVCIPRICSVICRLMRRSGGSCVNGRCRCNRAVKEPPASEDSFDKGDEQEENLDDEIKESIMQIAEHTLDSSDALKWRKCNDRICNAICRLKRYNKGSCVNDQCQCGTKDSSNKEDTIGEEADTENGQNLDKIERAEDALYVEENPQKDRCVPRVCKLFCRIIQSGDGNCVGGRCRCNREAKEPTAAYGVLSNLAEEFEPALDDGFKDVPERPKCNPRVCKRLCRLRRFDSGACVDGRCECFKKEYRVPADIVADEMEESRVVYN